MTKLNPEAILSAPDFTFLHDDKLSLNAPVLDGVVQIENFDELPSTPLGLVIASDRIEIYREDGRDLQVELNVRGGSKESPNRVSVFQRPISKLHLVSLAQPNAPHLWGATNEGIGLLSVLGFRMFLGVTGDIARGKQRNNRKPSSRP